MNSSSTNTVPSAESVTMELTQVVALNDKSTLGYCGVFGYVRIQANTKNLRHANDSATEATAKEISFLIMPSFFKKAVELRSRRYFGQMSRSLNFFPVVPKISKIFWMCLYGRVEELRDALSHRKFSPHVRDEEGRTLLHYTVQHSRVETCLLLLRLGVDPDQMDTSGVKALYQVAECWRTGFDPSEAVIDTIRLMITA